MEAPPQGYRRNVGLCLVNDSKKVRVVLMRLKTQRTAAMRELREETGVNSAEILAEVPYWLTYDFPPEVRAKLQQQWGSDWKGQSTEVVSVRITMPCMLCRLQPV
ncbi:nudix hydrolase 26 chloroplastic isoform X1 [Prunus yedoensis var. nudiflora]|uniref:Nudix hydrolase 26 chloroplastic isoform X1 n=1 Tax=Prunus yedoensis var. nudiflora TaxID=2094558 RepID=A0A314XT68_PRUYE|nr:nudix hydrolase 26 chloroplastic isoform X1 [Prunus yedoensis var. nudiflora]